jgi:hypothetical protein
MMTLLLALQKIAKPGDGLHPELARLLENSRAEKEAPQRAPELASTVIEQAKEPAKAGGR